MAIDSPKFVSAHDLQAQVNELTKRVTALEATSSLSTPATDDLDAAKAKIDAEQSGLTGADKDQMIVDEAASETAADPQADPDELPTT